MPRPGTRGRRIPIPTRTSSTFPGWMKRVGRTTSTCSSTTSRSGASSSAHPRSSRSTRRSTERWSASSLGTKIPSDRSIRPARKSAGRWPSGKVEAMERNVAALGRQPAAPDKFAFVRWLAAWVGGLSIWSRLRWAGFLFVLPALIHLATFKFYPMLEAFWLSFHRYDLMSPPVFNGLRNYQVLWENPLFHQSFWVSVTYMFGVALPEWFLALGLALLLNRQIPGRSLIRLAYFFPIAMSQIVVAMVWKFMYHPYGLVNTILEFFWIGRINWLSTEETALPALIIIGIWRGIPLFAVLYLAGLQAIPKEYREAAAIDGAGPFQRFFYVTIPLLRPTILLVIVMSLLSAVKVFLNPLVMTEGGPNGTTRVLPYFIYETGFAYFRMGEAAAASMVLFAFVFGLTLVQLRLLRSGGVE